MTSASKRRLSRRKLVASIGIIGLGLTAAACSPGTPGPTAGSQPAAPAKAAPTAPPAKPTAAPAAAKPKFSRATLNMGFVAGILTNAIWAMGKKKGFFDEFGIDLNVIGAKDGVTILTSLLANDIDFADTGIGTLLAAIEKGASIKLLGSLRPGLDFVVYGQKNINGIKELEGKSVGTAAPGAFLELLMKALFEETGVDASKVNFVNIGASPAVYQAVVAGKVAAGPSLVDYLPTADKDGVKPLVEVWKVLPNYVNWSMVSNAKTMQEKSDALTRAMAGYIKSHRYMLQPDSKAEFVQVAVDEFQAERASAEFTWGFYNNNKIINPNGDLTPQQTDYMQKLNINSGSQAKVLPFTQVVDPSIVQKANELLRS